jgi:hypothetical protein
MLIQPSLSYQDESGCNKFGRYHIPIWDKSANTAGEILCRSPVEAWNLYGKSQKRAGLFYQRTGLHGMKANEFTRTVRLRLENPYPKAYILIGLEAFELALVVKLVPIGLRNWFVRRQMGLLGQRMCKYSAIPRMRILHLQLAVIGLALPAVPSQVLIKLVVCLESESLVVSTADF